MHSHARRLLASAVPLILLSLPWLPGCGDEGLFGDAKDTKRDTIADEGDFPGCIAAVALDTGRIQIDYEFPPGARKLTVYRDGVVVTTQFKSATTRFIDTGLHEGQTYTYQCEAVLSGQALLGNRSLTATTLAFNPPVFLGVTTAQDMGPNTALVSWQSAANGGPTASSFEIYVSRGTTLADLNFGAAPRATVQIGSLSAAITGLGDELPYVFGVRACTSNHICDANTAFRAIDPMPNGGPPGTPGVDTRPESVLAANGGVTLTASWAEAQGAVAVRRVYGSTTASFTPSLANQVQVFPVPDLRFDPPNQLRVVNGPASTANHIDENTDYYFIVRDEDPGGRLSTNTATVHVRTGDLTAPIFGGATTLVRGASGFEDTQLIARFTGIAAQGTADAGASNGATYYIAYLTTDPTADACSKTSLDRLAGAGSNADGVKVLANTFPMAATGDIVLSGLVPRTYHSVCVKAQDAAFNLSSDAGNARPVNYTLDRAAPSFAGAEKVIYDAGNARLDLFFTPSTAADIDRYRFTFWKNTTSPAGGDIPMSRGFAAVAQLVDPESGLLRPGIALTPGEISFADGKTLNQLNATDSVYVIIDACDNARLIPSTPAWQDNCTAFATSTRTLARNIVDMQSPQGFEGVLPANQFVAAGSGSLTVKWRWTPPAVSAPDLADYVGFTIYHVEDLAVSPHCNNTPLGLSGAKELGGKYLCKLASPNCAVAGACVAGDAQATVSGLKPYKTYNFFVVGRDAAGNESTNRSPGEAVAAHAPDTTAPLFSSTVAQATGPTSCPAGPVVLKWQPISFDDQDATDSAAVVRYDLYRKDGSVFSPSGQPFNDAGAQLVTTVTQAATAPALMCGTDSGVSEGHSYFYTVCARDSSNNRICEGITPPILIQDVTPPTITGLVHAYEYGTTTDRAVSSLSKRYDLAFTMYDNSVNTDQLRVTVYTRVTSAASGPAVPTTSDGVLSHASCGGPCTGVQGLPKLGGGSLPAGAGLVNAGTALLAGVTGQAGTASWNNYLIEIDDTRNKRSASISVYTDNQLTLSSVKRNVGAIAGQNFVVVRGTGFVKSSESGFPSGTIVTFANGSGFSAACTSPVVWDPTRLTCKAPAGPGGGGNVRVTIANPEGSTAATSSGATYTGYLYQNGSHLCDQAADASGFAATSGNGTSTGPFKICTAAQLNLVRQTSPVNYLQSVFNYQLEDTIDLGGGQTDFTAPIGGNIAAGATLASTNTFRGHFHGNGHALLNWTYSNTGKDDVGLFGATGLCSSACNFSHAACTAWTSGCVLADTLLGNFSITGNDYVGTLVGRAEIASRPLRVANAYFQSSVTAHSFVGGLAGYLTTGTHEISDAVGDLALTASGSTAAGGLLGQSHGLIRSSGVRGTMTLTTAFSLVGGLIGYHVRIIDPTSCPAEGCPSVDSSWSLAAISCQAGCDTIGGLIGQEGSPISGSAPPPVLGSQVQDSWAAGSIVMAPSSGTVQSIGGLIGSLYPGSVLRSYSKTTINFNGNLAASAGGLVGYMRTGVTAPYTSCRISKSFSTTSILPAASSSTGKQSGGIIGYALGPTSGSTTFVEDNYAIGSYTGYSYVGAICGQCDSGVRMQRNLGMGFITATSTYGGISGTASSVTGETVANFHDSQIYNGNSFGSGPGSAGGTGQSSTNLQTQSTFTNVGWDFGSTWKFRGPNTYPVLMWEP